EPSVKVKLLEADVAHLGEAQTGGIGEFENCLHAQIIHGLRRGRFEQPGDFIVGHRRAQAFRTADQREVCSDARREAFFIDGEARICPDRGYVPCRAGSAAAGWPWVPTEIKLTRLACASCCG